MWYTDTGLLFYPNTAAQLLTCEIIKIQIKYTLLVLTEEISTVYEHMRLFHWQPHGTMLSRCLHHVWCLKWSDFEHKLCLLSGTCSHSSAINLSFYIYIYCISRTTLSMMDEEPISSCVSLSRRNFLFFSFKPSPLQELQVFFFSEWNSCIIKSFQRLSCFLSALFPSLPYRWSCFC